MNISRRTRRRLAAAIALLTALVLLTPMAAHAEVVTGNAATIVASNRTSYKLTRLFATEPGIAIQGLAYYEGVFYAGTDLKNGNGRMDGYDRAGRKVSTTGTQPFGHANSIDITGWKAYLTDGPRDRIQVWDIHQRKITRTYRVALSEGAVAGLDRARNQLVIVTGPTGGPYDLVKVNVSTGGLVSRTRIADYGVTQGIAVYGDRIVLLTSHLGPGGRTVLDDRSNNLTVLTMAGAKVRSIKVPLKNESEGLSIRRSNGEVFLGALTPPRISALEPL
jgi:hypothetical protein